MVSCKLLGASLKEPASSTVFRSYSHPDQIKIGWGRHTKIESVPPNDIPLTLRLNRRGGSYSGVRIHDLGYRRTKGLLLPLNPYIRFDFNIDTPMGSAYGRNKCGAGPTNWDFRWDVCTEVSGIPESADSASALCDRLQGNLNVAALQQAAAADALPSFDALTALAEAEGTARMLVSCRNRAKRLILQALKGGKHTAKAAADAWLEWRYGWRTLLYDMEDAAEAYNTPVRDLFIEGRAGASFALSEYISTPTYTYHCTWDNVTQLNYDLSVRANVVLHYDMASTNVLASPLVTAWELIPYSFIADWFVSAGEAIAAWVVTSKSRSYFSSFGRKLKVDGITGVENPRLGNGPCAASPYGVSAFGTASVHFKSRVPLGPLSHIPQIRVKLTSARLLDAAALLMKRIL